MFFILLRDNVTKEYNVLIPGTVYNIIGQLSRYRCIIDTRISTIITILLILSYIDNIICFTVEPNISYKFP
ncbi:hypothetical protein HZS_7292 [Henneguya salminicola]|nr:hypothetical protein HZS_7292 [Henneguya salminicola]